MRPMESSRHLPNAAVFVACAPLGLGNLEIRNFVSGGVLAISSPVWHRGTRVLSHHPVCYLIARVILHHPCLNHPCVILSPVGYFITRVLSYRPCVVLSLVCYLVTCVILSPVCCTAHVLDIHMKCSSLLHTEGGE